MVWCGVVLFGRNYRPDHCQYGHSCRPTPTSTPWTGAKDGELMALLHGNRQVFHNEVNLPFRYPTPCAALCPAVLQAVMSDVM